MTGIALNPLLPLWALALLAALGLGAAALSFWRGARGAGLRALAGLVLALALLDPSLRREARAPLGDVGFLVIDETASQSLESRAAQTAEAAEALRAQAAALGLELREIRLADAPEGSAPLSALAEAAAQVAPKRIAGAVLVGDGQAADAEALADFPGPVHLLLSGRADEADLRMTLLNAPAFGVVGETAPLRAVVEPLGKAEAGGPVTLTLSTDGETRLRHSARIGHPFTIALPIDHGGRMAVELAAEPLPGELTDRNNRAVFTVNGVRDRLRVLLVSGEPHPGERTWRNLLKADPAVDLVHFTILRPPSKQDGTPVFELSLIAFPTRELFLEKIDDFDLIIFDRYRRRGILPSAYLANIARYVRDGGAVLLAEGDSFAGVESLYRSPLEGVIPARPTTRVLEEGYAPEVTETGARHPITRGLSAAWGGAWGRWLRQVEVENPEGPVLMEGAGAAPLLIAAREGKGRVALLASDQAWLWTRGFEGGGPQAELLRRLAHWLMKEPELEEEALIAQAGETRIRVERRSLGAGPTTLRATAPDGETVAAPFRAEGAGRWVAEIDAETQGLWRFDDGELTAAAALGPAQPREFENPVSGAAALAPLLEATGGAARRLAEGVPDLRLARAGATMAGRGWIGLARRDAYDVTALTLTPLAPAWAALLVVAGLMVAAWRAEGR